MIFILGVGGGGHVKLKQSLMSYRSIDVGVSEFFTDLQQFFFSLPITHFPVSIALVNMSKTDQLARQQIALPNLLKIPRGTEEALFPRNEDIFGARASDSRCTYFCVDL